MDYCGCLGVRAATDAVRDIADEAKELLEVKNLEEFKDEFSDVTFGLGRLVAGLIGKVYVRMPFDAKHVAKIDKRMSEYGCVRSRRHLVDGVCASA